MKHSPGPWKLVDHDEEYIAITDELQDEGVCKVAGTYKRETMEANARLIVAAPDMLKALEKLHAMYADFSRVTFDLVETRSLLKSAIDKARAKP